MAKLYRFDDLAIPVYEGKDKALRLDQTVLCKMLDVSIQTMYDRTKSIWPVAMKRGWTDGSILRGRRGHRQWVLEACKALALRGRDFERGMRVKDFLDAIEAGTIKPEGPDISQKEARAIFRRRRDGQPEVAEPVASRDIVMIDGYEFEREAYDDDD